MSAHDAAGGGGKPAADVQFAVVEFFDDASVAGGGGADVGHVLRGEVATGGDGTFFASGDALLERDGAVGDERGSVNEIAHGDVAFGFDLEAVADASFDDDVAWEDDVACGEVDVACDGDGVVDTDGKIVIEITSIS